MTSTAEQAAMAPQFHLWTLGTLLLTGPADDTVLGDHGHQRRRLALLAVLAAAGQEGRSRDQLQGLFWPEVPQSRARHSLEQLLYAIRNSLGGEAFLGVNPVRLNGEMIIADIISFRDAIARGDLEAAAAMYRGPFLDGFYLADAAEFGTWMDTERARIERMYMDTLERLAKAAEDAGDYAAAVRWRLRQTETDPLSGKHAAALIRAQMSAGDHSAALQFAERHERIVTKELGTSAGPAVAALIAELRTRRATEPAAKRNAGPSRMPPPNPAPLTPPVATHPESVVPPATPAFRSPRKSRALVYVVGGVLLLSSLGIAARWLRTPAPSPASPRTASSIAVLPLANVSGDPRDVALVDGITEELIGVLGKIGALQVTARTSAFVFRNSNLDVRQIADSLHVANILEGGVQRIGQGLRVQVRLIDGRNGSTLWSETYDRKLEDIFAMQSDIAGAVANQLNLRLGPRTIAALRRPPTRNMAAYEAYLRGSDPALLRSDSAARRAFEYLAQAVSLDSNYAAAHAGVARMYLRLRETRFSTGSSRTGWELAERSALRAVALDDSLSEAHATLGLVRMHGYEFGKAEQELKRAVALDPGNSRIREWMSFLHYWRGTPAGAVTETGKAVENDPLSPSANAEYARALCSAGRVDEGLAHLKHIEVQPPLARVNLYTAMCHGMKGDWATAAAMLRGSESGIGSAALGHALARSGNREEALVVLSDLVSRWKTENKGTFLIAIVHAGLGNRDEAFDWLDRSVSNASLMPQLVQPFLDGLRSDPRFLQLERREVSQKR